jgi:hypothetical protein
MKSDDEITKEQEKELRNLRDKVNTEVVRWVG